VVGGPSGTVTFLFTDIEGSTRLWALAPDAMRGALERHDLLARQAIEQHHGYVFATGGDGFAAAFGRAGDAADAAMDLQELVGREEWPAQAPIRVRAGLHTGEAVERGGDYFGPAVNEAARLMALGHGGQVLCSAATAAIMADGRVLIDLGDQHLRDLSSPRRVFQVGEGVFPPLASPDVRPTNLPLQRTSFVGREHELKTTLDALDRSSSVTLTGVGGVGKTRLALEVASHLLGELVDGAWLVELGAVADADALWEVTASALGVLARPGQSPREAIVAFLRQRRLLLVVDNCEHLLDAVAALVDEVLSACPHVRVLATSREALGVPGEQIVAVPTLSLPAGDEDDLGDALRLLLDRAPAPYADAALSGSARTALVEICRRVDGIPLAIELAAARLRSMTPEELVTRLDQRFRLLAGGRRVAVNRQQTLRSTIDWSYDLLDPTDRTVLQRVAVFAGGFDLPAAEVVCDDVDSDVLDGLARLVDKSLLIATTVGPVTRYRMLETIRDYALERLRAEQPLDDVRRRHAAYFAGWSARAGAGLRGPDETSWVEAVERETENLRTALLWSIDAGELDLAVDLVAPLMLEVLPTDDTVGSLAELCLTAPGIQSHERYPQVAAFAAYDLIWQGHVEEGSTVLAEARRVMEARPPRPEMLVRVLSSEMIAAVFVAGFDEAVRIAERRTAAAREAGDEYELCRALGGWASLVLARGGDALALAQEGATIARRIGNPLLVSSSLYAVAGATMPVDQATGARVLREAEAAAVANPRMLNVILGLQAQTLRASGDVRGVAEIVLRAVELEWTTRRHIYLSTASLDVLMNALAGALPEPAAVIGGLCSRNINAHALEGLSERLGAERYTELFDRGAAMQEADIVDFVRSVVREVGEL
jgi:predicted ATPase/class 3 adenylate cyclase